MSVPAASSSSTPASGPSVPRSRSNGASNSARMRFVSCLDYSKEVTPADYLAVAATSAGGAQPAAAQPGEVVATNGNVAAAAAVGAPAPAVTRGARAQRKSKTDAISRMDKSSAPIDALGPAGTAAAGQNGSAEPSMMANKGAAPMTPESGGSDDAVLPPVMSLLPDTPPPSLGDGGRMSTTTPRRPATRANNPISKRARLQKAPKYDVPAHDLASHHDPPGTTRPFGLEECPAYHPSAEEFKDPMRYIQSIAKEAAEYGICKIIPPAGWEMPFTLDTELFHFRTRLQRPSQLEATSRDRMNFLDKLYRFHKQQGDPNATVPTIDGKALDLWTLHREVSKRGGFAAVSARNLWAPLAVLLKYEASRAPYLKMAYEKVVKPYDDFYARVKNSPTALKHSIAATTTGAERQGSPVTPTQVPRAPPTQSMPPSASGRMGSSMSRGSSESSAGTPSRATSSSAAGGQQQLAPPLELHRLDSSELKVADEIVQAGSAASKKRKRQKDVAASDPATPPTKRLTLRLKTSATAEADVYKKGDACEVCRSGKNATKLLLCDDCDRGFHIYCLDPPLSQVPKNEEWFCTECLINTGNDFGFEEGDEHSLYSFAKRAHAFKSDWFRRWAVHGRSKEHPSERDIEEEYWRLTSSDSQEVEVEYGADLRSAAHGSAAPVIETYPFHEASMDGWNLNNLPILPGSLLKYIRSDISGMTVPWIYVGMLFSTFCWHNEDHWTYSVNYQYWGATKTWYGIPGSDAERFEHVMRQEAPDLFEGSPGLLFDLITMMNPGKIKDNGVKVYACNQGPGEFVITFPKAYHCGFNQGLNFNEAVNFALPDWLGLGGECVRHYQKFEKAPVFSHDELLVTIAQNNKTVDTASWLRSHFSAMVEREIAQRALVDFAVVRTEDRSEATCARCKQFCYLSQVFCDGCDKLGCAEHWDTMCDHPSQLRRLRIRFTIDELQSMRRELNDRADIPTRWQMRLQALLDGSAAPDLKEIRALLAEGNKLDLLVPDMIALRPWMSRVDEWITDASIFFERPSHGRKRVKKGSRVTDELDEDSEDERWRAKRDPEGITALLRRANKLSFRSPELDQLTRLQADIRNFKTQARAALSGKDTKLKEVQELVILGRAFNVNLPILRDLTSRYNQLKWISDMDELDEAFLELDDISAWLERAQNAGIDPANEYYCTLLKRRGAGQAWASKVRAVLLTNDQATKSVESTISRFRKYWKSLSDVNVVAVTRDHKVVTPLSELEDLLRPNVDQPFVGEFVSNLTALRNKALSIQQQMRTTLSAGKHKTIGQVLKQLVAHSTKCPSITFPELWSLRSIADDYLKWLQRASSAFKLYSPSTTSLPHPRSEPDKYSSFLEYLQEVADVWRPKLDPADDFPKTSLPGATESPRPICVCRRQQKPGDDVLRCGECREIYHTQCTERGDWAVVDSKKQISICHWCRDPDRYPLGLYYTLSDREAMACRASDLAWLASYPPNVDARFDEYDLIKELDALIRRALAVLLPILVNATLVDHPFIKHWGRKLQTLQIDIDTDRSDIQQFYLDVHEELLQKHKECSEAARKAKRQRHTPTLAKLLDRNNWPHFVFTFTEGCVCRNRPFEAPSPKFPLVTVRCRICKERYHAECVEAPEEALGSNGKAWNCPKCCADDGSRYEYAPVEIQLVEHQKTAIYVDTAATLLRGSEVVTRMRPTTKIPCDPSTVHIYVDRFVPGRPAQPGSLIKKWQKPRPELVGESVEPLTWSQSDDESDSSSVDEWDLRDSVKRQREDMMSKVKLPPLPTSFEMPRDLMQPKTDDSPSVRLARLLAAGAEQRGRQQSKQQQQAEAPTSTPAPTVSSIAAESPPAQAESGPSTWRGFPDLSVAK